MVFPPPLFFQLSISRYLLVTSDHTIRRSKGGSVYYKRFFDSIVLGSFSRELSYVEFGGLKGRNSPYFIFLLPERGKRVESDQKNLWCIRGRYSFGSCCTTVVRAISFKFLTIFDWAYFLEIFHIYVYPITIQYFIKF